MNIDPTEKERIDLLIARFLNHTASSDEIKAIEEWIKQDNENKTYFSTMKNSFAIASMFAEKMETKVQHKTNALTRRIPLRRFLYYAAAVLVIGIIFYSLAIYIQMGEAARLTTLIVPRGQHAELLLSDGTKVWVNAESQFSYPSVFRGNKREVILKGEAFFKVKSDPTHPFIVHANQLSVMAVGTQFDVSAYPCDKTIRVFLKKGKLHVYRNAQPERQMVLLASQSAIYNVDKHLLEAGELSNPEAWKDGHITVNMEQFSDIVRQLERVYSVDITVQNPKLDSLVLSGDFNANDPIETVLEAMSVGHVYRYKVDGKKIVIY